MQYSGSTAAQLAEEVVHQLNTPLGAMMVAVELAISSLRENPDQAFQRLDKALRAIKQMQNVLAGLTDLAWEQHPQCTKPTFVFQVSPLLNFTTPVLREGGNPSLSSLALGESHFHDFPSELLGQAGSG